MEQPVVDQNIKLSESGESVSPLYYLQVLLSAVRSRLILFFSILTITTGAATFYAVTAPAVYRAETQLAPAGSDDSAGVASLVSQFGNLSSLMGLSTVGKGGEVEQHLAVLKSRKFIGEYIKENGLMPILFSEEWNESGGRWKSDIKVPTAWKASETFRKNVLVVAADKKTGLLTIAIDWTDPALAADWANSLIKRLNEYLRADAIAEAERSIDYLRSELPKTSVVEMQQAIYRLIEAQTKIIMLANAREQFAFKVLDPANVPEKKIKPRRKLIVITGFVFGMLVAFLTVQLAELMFRTKSAGNIKL